MRGTTEVLLSGWGRTSPSAARLVRPTDADAIADAVRSGGSRGVLARGLGRSYGDVAQNGGGTVVDMTAFAGIERFDRAAGSVTALAGTSFADLLRVLIPSGWFLPVTPGTRSVTVGGAIANDIHGKNHHRDGGLGTHVTGFELLTPDGEVHSVGRDDHDLFDATLGGIGLTGIVLRATLELLPIGTAFVRVDTERAHDLDDLMARMEAGDDAYRYSVAWVDGLARGPHFGRGVLTRGDHAVPDDLAAGQRDDPLRFQPRQLPAVPRRMPSLATPLTARAFNEVWFRKAPRERRDQIMTIGSFFYPLDAVAAWNRLYGRNGFVQYQSVVPFGAEETLRRILGRLVAETGASFLAVLKRFGPGRGMLSFPIAGWTLALDLPVRVQRLGRVLQRCDADVVDAGGRVYLAKDARLDPAFLPSMYPDLDRWRDVRERLDPKHVLRSDLARRIALDRTRAPEGVRT
jgi:decaprenylphospho-beta-D-ribofuranose 2-oxidase